MRRCANHGIGAPCAHWPFAEEILCWQGWVRSSVCLLEFQIAWPYFQSRVNASYWGLAQLEHMSGCARPFTVVQKSGHHHALLGSCCKWAWVWHMQRSSFGTGKLLANACYGLDRDSREGGGQGALRGRDGVDLSSIGVCLDLIPSFSGCPFPLLGRMPIKWQL